jgi:hypothetical protein
LLAYDGVIKDVIKQAQVCGQQQKQQQQQQQQHYTLQIRDKLPS